MKRTASVLALCLLATSVAWGAAAAPPIEPKERIALFDGKTLDGLFIQGKKQTWSVKEGGVLACSGRPAGYIRTVKDYANYHLRLEYFPRYSEVFAVSFFYKDLNSAIETSLNSQPNYLDLLSWFNGDGFNYGFELEMRTRLDFISQSLYDVTLGGNYTRVWSEVEFFTLENPDDPDESAGTRSDTRPLQGQAPWVINLSLKWESLSLGTTATLLYNRIGRRLTTVAEDPAFNVYEEPRHLLDAAVTQELWGSLGLKIGLQNILSESRTFVHDVDQGPGTREPQVLPYGFKTDRLTLKVALKYKF
mgnify:CR=1 FL=1